MKFYQIITLIMKEQSNIIDNQKQFLSRKMFLLLILLAVSIVLNINNLNAQSFIDKESMQKNAQNAVLNAWQPGKLRNSKSDDWKITIDQPGVLFIRDSLLKYPTLMGEDAYYYYIHLYCESGKLADKLIRITNYKREGIYSKGIKLGVLPGTYFLRFSPTINGSYSLYPSFSVVDEIEGQNETKETATEMLPNTKNTGSTNFWNPNTDKFDEVDWWRLQIDNASLVNFEVNKVINCYNTRYNLYSEDLKRILLPVYPKGNNKANLLPGTYYFKVAEPSSYGGYNKPTNTYQIFPEIKIAAEDFEPNDSRENAQDIMVNTESGGNIGFWNPETNKPDQEDWLKITLYETGILNIRDKVVKPFNGSYDIELWSENGKQFNRIGYWLKRHSEKELPGIKRPLYPDTYYVRITYKGTTQGGAYSIIPDFTPIREDIEKNDSSYLAQFLGLNETNYGNIGFYNPELNAKDWSDWLAINVPQAGELEIKHQYYKLMNSHDAPVYGIYAYSEDLKSAKVAMGGMVGSNGIKFGVSEGTIYLKLGNKSSSNHGAYAITTSFNSASISDNDEPNNTKAEATNIPLNTINRMGRTGYWNPQTNEFDNDFYRFTIPESGRLSVNYEVMSDDPASNYQLKNISIIKDDALETYISPWDKFTSRDYIVIGPGTYYLRITSNRQHYASYSFSLIFKSDREIRDSKDRCNNTPMYTSNNRINPDYYLCTAPCANSNDAIAEWDPVTEKVVCMCLDENFYWDDVLNECLVKRSDNTQQQPPDIEEKLNNAPCAYVNNAIAEWDEVKNRVVCRCIDEDYIWDNKLNKCVPKSNTNTQVNTNTNGNTYDECLYSICPECIDQIILAGQSPNVACQKCLDDKVNFILECMKDENANTGTGATANNQSNNNNNNNPPDCASMYPNTIPKWNEEQNSYDCDCKNGYEWNTTSTACILKIPDCDLYYPNTVTTLNNLTNEYECNCIPGYVWNANNTACEKEKPNCNIYYPNTVATLNNSTNEYECDCIPGYVWNASNTGCEKEKPNCNVYYPNTVATMNYSTNEYECDCIPGYVWNASNTGCEKEKPNCNALYPNTFPRWNNSTNEYECDCIPGYEWNAARNGCVQAKPKTNLGDVLGAIATGIISASNGNYGAINPGYPANAGGGNVNSKPAVQKQSNCNDQQQAGANVPEVHTIDLGQSFGNFVFDYETFTAKDQIIITNGGTTIFNSGCVGEHKSIQLNLNGYSPTISVRVNPNCDGGSSTQWNFTVHCPNN